MNTRHPSTPSAAQRSIALLATLFLVGVLAVATPAHADEGITTAASGTPPMPDTFSLPDTSGSSSDTDGTPGLSLPPGAAGLTAGGGIELDPLASHEGESVSGGAPGAPLSASAMFAVGSGPQQEGLATSGKAGEALPTTQSRTWTLTGPWDNTSYRTGRIVEDTVEYAFFESLNVTNGQLDARMKLQVPREGRGVAALTLAAAHRRSWTVPEDGLYTVKFIYGYSDDLWLSYSGRPKGGEYALANLAVWYGLCSQPSYCGQASSVVDLRREHIAEGDIDPREIKINPTLKTVTESALTYLFGVSPEVSKAAADAVSAILESLRLYSKGSAKAEFHSTWSEVAIPMSQQVRLSQGQVVELYVLTLAAAEVHGRSDSRANADFRFTGAPVRVTFTKAAEAPQPPARPSCPVGSTAVRFSRASLSGGFAPPMAAVTGFELIPQARLARKPTNLSLLVRSTASGAQRAMDLRWNHVFTDPNPALTDDEYWASTSPDDLVWTAAPGQSIRVFSGWAKQMAYGVDEWQFCVSSASTPANSPGSAVTVESAWTTDLNFVPRSSFGLHEAMKIVARVRNAAPGLLRTCFVFDLQTSEGWQPRAVGCYDLGPALYRVSLTTTPEQFGAGLGMVSYRVRAIYAGGESSAQWTFVVR